MLGRFSGWRHITHFNFKKKCMSQRTFLNFHIPNMVHTFINQSFKIFRVPVISVKTHGHALLLPLSKKFFSSLPPLKIAIFWLNIYPSIFDFSSCPIINLIDYNCDYVFIPYSFWRQCRSWWIFSCQLNLWILIFAKGEATRPLHFNLYINHWQEKLITSFIHSPFFFYPLEGI